MKFDEVIDKIKIIMMYEREKHILDKDVAEELGITATNFSMMRNRETLPIKNISIFCLRKKASINWVLFDQKPLAIHKWTCNYIEFKSRLEKSIK